MISPHTNQIITVITKNFKRPARKGIESSHRRTLAPRVLGFGALVELSVCAGRGKRHAAGLQLDDFRCFAGTTQLEVEKFYSMVNVLHKGTTQTEKLLP